MKKVIALIMALCMVFSIAIVANAEEIVPYSSEDRVFSFTISGAYSDETGPENKDNDTSSYILFNGGRATIAYFQIRNSVGRNCTECGTVELCQDYPVFVRQDVYEYAAKNNFRKPYKAKLWGRGNTANSDPRTASGLWSPDSTPESGVPTV